MRNLFKNLFKKNPSPVSDNPFTRPYIYDKNIDIFHECPVCKASLYDDGGIPLVRPDTVWYYGESILVLGCKICKSKFRFRNWDKPRSK